mgnify:CR=1 FL=1
MEIGGYYFLVLLYDVETSNNSKNNEEIYADDEIPQYEGVPADGTHHGTPTASQPLCPKASQSPKNKIEEKDKNLFGSIPQYEGIQSPKTNQQKETQTKIPRSPTEEEFHLCFDTYNVCLNLQNHYRTGINSPIPNITT